MNEDNTSNSAASGTAKTITVEATTGEAMHELGKHVAHLAHGCLLYTSDAADE